jgi:uncharacterized protein YhbP (UPF0306 family)
MQLATARGQKPWVCTVFYVVDDQFNFYWLSLPTRRHSQEIRDNNNAAVTVVIKPDLPVIGIYAEGVVTVEKAQSEVKKIAQSYVEKYNAATTFYDRFVKGINQHWIYKLTPTEIILFDEYNNKDNPVQKVKLKGKK